jgi:predicted ATPase
VLTTLPETAARVEQEIALHVALGQALMAARGQGVPEVERAFSRAWTLCRQVGESPQRFPVLWGLWRFYFMQAKHRTDLELGEECLSLAQRAQDPALLLPGHLALGVTCFQLGDQVSARAHLEQGTTLYDPQQHRALAFRYGIDLHVWCLSYVAWPLWLLGYPDQALQRSHEALSLARDLAHPLSLVAALDYAAWLHQFRCEAPVTQAHAEAAIALAREHGFPQYETLGVNLRNWALAAQGQGATAGTAFRQAMADNLAVGSANIRPYLLSMLAALDREQPEVGLAALAEALSIVDTTDERWWEAELYRLKGDLVLQSGAQRHASGVLTPDAPPQRRDAEAEACFHHALAIARGQQARSLELRAAMSLARLWQRQGKCQAAHDLLVPIYGWFTEGFDTADLQEARAQLEELA